MPTKKILVIRHAEKPEPHGAGGVEPSGKPDTESLTPQGWQRAGALVRFFSPRSGNPPAPLERPKYLFAAKADLKADHHSKRSYQTIAPLAAHLQLAVGIDDSLRKSELKELISKATSVDGAVLIAWEHKCIPPMARLLVQDRDAVPDWPEDRFDMVWAFDRTGATWRLTQVPQLLLAGDKAETFT